MSLPTGTLGWLAIGLTALGFGLAVFFSLRTANAPLARALARYRDARDRDLRFLHSDMTGAQLVRTQAIAVLGFTAAGFFLGDMLVGMLALVAAIAPYLVLQSRCKDRTARIEKQIDGWLLALANALKATPSLGEALASSVTLTQAPLSEEIETTLKELALGSPMDEALTALAGRVDSPTLWGAVATLQVSRNTGGDVPRILEETAATLREMERLEAVVRTKTADGRSQAQVLAFMPFFVVAAIHLMDPNWLRPLTESGTGMLIIAGSTTLWLAGFLVARKVLNVDV